jgi:hypothetical protein
MPVSSNSKDLCGGHYAPDQKTKTFLQIHVDGNSEGKKTELFLSSKNFLGTKSLYVQGAVCD